MYLHCFILTVSLESRRPYSCICIKTVFCLGLIFAEFYHYTVFKGLLSRTVILKKLVMYEKSLLNSRTTIIKEQAIFKGLLGKAGKYKKAVDNSAQNVVKLKEQLEAAEKIYTANKEQFDVVRKQVCTCFIIPPTNKV